MDKIFLRELSFYGYHGCLPEETVIGQNFLVDIEIWTDLKEAGATDDLSKTVNYAEVYDIAKNIVESKIYKTLEKVAEEITSVVLSTFRIQCIKVKITKPAPPINGHYKGVGIEIVREYK